MSDQLGQIAQDELDFLLDNDLTFLESYLQRVRHRLELIRSAQTEPRIAIRLTQEQADALAQEVIDHREYILQMPQIGFFLIQASVAGLQRHGQAAVNDFIHQIVAPAYTLDTIATLEELLPQPNGHPV